MGRSQGVAITCVAGAAGALGGTCLFRVHTSHGPVSLPAWLTATGGTAALLAVCHLISGRAGHPMAHR